MFDFDAMFHTEAMTTVSASLMIRRNPVATSEYPTAPYIENIGVRPDIYYDYMTRENLMSGGADFVRAFTRAVVEAAGGN